MLRATMPRFGGQDDADITVLPSALILQPLISLLSDAEPHLPTHPPCRHSMVPLFGALEAQKRGSVEAALSHGRTNKRAIKSDHRACHH